MRFHFTMKLSGRTKVKLLLYKNNVLDLFMYMRNINYISYSKIQRYNFTTATFLQE